MTDAASAPAFAPETAISPPQWQPRVSSILSRIFATLLVSAGVAAILWAWQLPPFATSIVRTDNAYIRGRTTIISPQVSGYIREISVNDYATVRPGDTLLSIDDRIYRAQVAAAKANLDVALANSANNRQAIEQRRLDITTAEAKIARAKAELVKAEADLGRATRLAVQGASSLSVKDTALAARDVAAAAVQEAIAGRGSAEQALKAAELNDAALHASVESARAQHDIAEVNLGYTVITAPEHGKLSDVTARRGQFITNGTQLMFLVPPARWVVANFKETQAGSIQQGQRAWFFVDALKGTRFEGRVEDVSPAAGSEFSLLRTDNAVGNFTKIPQRIAVRIRITDGQRDHEKLSPGMSVEANVDTSESYQK